jgi:hypothetical protein
MFKYGFFAVGLCLLFTSALSQSSSQLDGASAAGFWSNAANPNEHFELRADGQFSIDENGQHHEGTWDLHGNTLALHFSPSSIAKAQWDGQAFIDNEQKRWVRATLTPASPSQSVASPSVSAPKAPAAHAQSGDQKAVLQEKLNSQFKVTKLTDDKTDIVTAGSVLVLHKDGLLMFSIDTKVPPTSTYKDGKLSMGFGTTFATNLALGQLQPGANCGNVPQRKFVAGEKFWIVGSAVKDDGLIIVVYSDPYQDVRYYGQVKFPFPKHNMPPAEDVWKTISEVVTAQPDDNAAGTAPPPAPVQEAPPQQSMAPIAPPPPPPDAPPPAPKTIKLGQPKDQVVTIFGQPTKVVKLGAKEIDYYPGMKITFVNNKVTDVQ